MKKSFSSLILGMVLSIGLIAQESSVLMTIGNENVSLEEFERIYKKNNNENSLNHQTPEEYLDLFINFKLKVMEAESLGMDTTTKFIKELEGYRKQLAKPYLSDEEAREEMMKEAYEWSKYDVHAAHILIRLPEGASPEDTLLAYNKIMEIRERIIGGEAFDVVAKATSDDASAQRNGGDLNYFTVFSMVYPFEYTAYNTPVGEISMPFKSSYGYHILKVIDKREARGTVKVSHIFVRNPAGTQADMTQKAHDKAAMIYDSLQAGADFASLARNHSEDPGSAREGGSIPWFGAGRMIPVFEDASFNIEEVGDYTEPFKSDYGWHIVILEGKRGIGTYEEMEPSMQHKINQGGRSATRTDRYVNKLKSEYGYTENPAALKPVYAAADSSLLSGDWVAGELKDLDSELIKIGDRIISTGEFAAYVELNQNRGKSKSVPSYLDALFNRYSTECVIAYEESMLAEKYPEFRYVYQEYHDGILLFDIMDQKVWTKAVEDSTGLASFHKAHKNEYMWGERIEAYQMTCQGDVDMTGLKSAAKKISKGKMDQEKLNEAYCNNDSTDCITLEHLLLEKGQNETLDALNGVPGASKIEDVDGVTYYTILKKVRHAEPKKLDEARGQITSDYQEYLEEQWIGELKLKYPVTVNHELLSEIK